MTGGKMFIDKDRQLIPCDKIHPDQLFWALEKGAGKAMTDTEIEQWAWETFAEAHPHEAYQTWPDRFWQFFQKKYPNISREQMEESLKLTDIPCE